jgi:hypothetical protein
MSHPSDQTAQDASNSLARAERAVAQADDDPNTEALNSLQDALEDEREDLQGLS